MSSGVLVRQALARGESHRAASVLARMREVEGVPAVLSRLGVHLCEASLGQSHEGPYVYYRIEPDREGGLAGRYHAVVEAAVDETDAVAEVVTAFDRLADGDPESVEFRPLADEQDETDSGYDSSPRASSNDSCPAED